MHCFQLQEYNSFRFPSGFDESISYIFFLAMNSMLGLDKEPQKLSYIQHLIYTHTLVLWITEQTFCQLFRNGYRIWLFHHKTFGSLLTAVNEEFLRIGYILENKYIYLLKVIRYTLSLSFLLQPASMAPYHTHKWVVIFKPRVDPI